MKYLKDTRTWVALASVLTVLIIVALAMYGVYQLVDRFFGNNVISPRSFIKTFEVQSPRLWVDKTTYKEEQEQQELIDGAVDKALEDILKPTLKPRSLKIGEVLAIEPIKCKDVISCIREVGESLNVPNRDIMTMIRIAKAESNFRPDAKNSTSSARGVFQILISTWEGNDCDGSRLNFQNNIVCAYKLYQARGFQPWNASKSIWSN